MNKDTATYKSPPPLQKTMTEETPLLSFLQKKGYFCERDNLPYKHASTTLYSVSSMAGVLVYELLSHSIRDVFTDGTHIYLPALAKSIVPLSVDTSAELIRADEYVKVLGLSPQQSHLFEPWNGKLRIRYFNDCFNQLRGIQPCEAYLTNLQNITAVVGSGSESIRKREKVAITREYNRYRLQLDELFDALLRDQEPGPSITRFVREKLNNL